MYYLKSSQPDRIAFDEMVERYAEALLNALETDEALAIADITEENKHMWELFTTDITEYTEDAWEDAWNNGIEADSMEEAKARFFSVFPAAIRNWQEEKVAELLRDELYLKGRGYTTSIQVTSVSVIEVVSLTEGNIVAFRHGDERRRWDFDWQIGDAEDVVNAWIEHRYVLAA